MWAIDFQFDSTVDGKAIKIASAVDEHTKQSVLTIVERSIDAPRLVCELQKAFAATGGPPQVLRMDNGPEFISQTLRGFCVGRVGLDYIPPGTPWNNGTAESFNSRMRRECLNRNHWTCLLEAQVAIADYKGGAQPQAPALSAGLPHPRRVRCPVKAHPHRGGPRDRLKHGNHPWTPKRGGPDIGYLPCPTPGVRSRDGTASRGTARPTARRYRSFCRPGNGSSGMVWRR